MKKKISTAQTQTAVNIQTGIKLISILISQSGDNPGKKQDEYKQYAKCFFVLPLKICQYRKQHTETKETVSKEQNTFRKYRAKAGHKISEQWHSGGIGLHITQNQRFRSKLQRLGKIKCSWIGTPEAKTVP